MRVFVTTVTILLVALIPAASEEESHGHDAEAHHDESGHHNFRHEIALFLGVTDEKGHDLEGTWGVEYAYALAPKIGIGGVLEYAGGDLRNLILVAPFVWKPVGDFFLLAGPGVEYHRGRGSSEHHAFKSGGEEDRDETYFLFRLGAGYSFHVGERYAIIPQVNLDLVNGEKVWVGGVAFGVMF